MTRLLSLCVFLYLVEVIQAAPTTNTTTTTTTSDSVKDPSFTTRTIWSIISSSVLTLFACIYSAIHPNIPNPKDSPSRILLRRLSMMVMALIAPELIVTWAMRQWFSSRLITREFNDAGYPNVCPESESPKMNFVEVPATGNRHWFLQLLAALVRGVPSLPVFLLRCPGSFARSVKKFVKAYFSEQSEDPTWTQTHSFFMLMGGFMLYVDGKPYCTLRHGDILKLIRKKCIDVPTLTANQIHDKSKGDGISKGLIILQAAWFVMELITRTIYRLETTQLEVGTLAFAVLNFLTYAVWWDKPLNVQCTHPVYWKLTESRPEDHIDHFRDRDEPDKPDEQYHSYYHKLAVAVLYFMVLVLRSIKELLGFRSIPTSRRFYVPTFDGSVNLEDADKKVLLLAGLLMASIFGGVHCMAWFFAFTTYREQVLWRMSAVAITFIPWYFYCVKFLIPASVKHYVQSAYSPLLEHFSFFTLVRAVLAFAYNLIFSGCFWLYIGTRVILLVLMFTTLRNLPPDAYKAVSWTSLVPHL
ncbi:uncharacterized protein EDB93DRAFT_693085 [Suillus bovinus]|uniref:uncharacterized protein n=1 Tax=Suillus bovinus TaxID=48563 RepID=UPI001B85C45D|nr:uncharacterized protein EDB93DRAFT_693085 [Suillus bovinus]KAG2139841.1 hypothetical protein EDB93DRAFT_693085 [Suillus bovinus]